MAILIWLGSPFLSGQENLNFTTVYDGLGRFSAAQWADLDNDGDMDLVFAGDDEEAVLDALMMADVDVSDLEYEDGKVSVFVPPTEHFKARQALQDAFGDIDFEVDEVQFIPQIAAELNAEDQEVLEKLLDMLNYVDDVQNVYCNAG